MHAIWPIDSFKTSSWPSWGCCAYTSLGGLWDMGTPGFPPTWFTAVPNKWVRPTRRPADLIVDPTDLICGPHDLRRPSRRFPRWPYLICSGNLACKTRQDIGYAAIQSEDHEIILFSLVRFPCCNRPRLGAHRPCLSANIRQTRPNPWGQVIQSCNPPKAIQSRTGRRVLLSGGLNQYKLVVSIVFHVLLRNLRVLSLRSLPAE
jgi:hypothetical protein